MPTMAEVKIDGEKLEKLRLERFWSRAELAEKSGISRDHIGRLERGEGGNSHPPTVRHLAEALGVDPNELLKAEE